MKTEHSPSPSYFYIFLSTLLRFQECKVLTKRFSFVERKSFSHTSVNEKEMFSDTQYES